MMSVGFSTTDALVSRAIRAVTRSRVSHCYLCFKLYDVTVVLQADHRGIGMESWERFSEGNKIVSQFNLALPFDGLMAEIVETLGAPYDYKGALGNGVVLLGQAIGKTLANPYQNKDHWYCSEWVAHLLKQAGEPLLEKTEPSAVSPQRLYAICLGSKFTTPVL